MIIEKLSSYIKRHWQGKMSLSTSFGINFMLLNFFSYLSMKCLDLLSLNLLTECRLKTLAFTFGGIVFIWQFIGCWRSAKLQKRISKDAFSGTAAQLILISSLLSIVHTLPLYWEHVKISLLQEEKYELKVKKGEIFFSGYIGYGLDDDIKEILEKNDILYINLSSQGGRTAVAKKVAKLIEDYKITTYTPTYCLSGCVRIFLAGSKRILGDGAKIGLHSSSFPGFTKSEILNLPRSSHKFYKEHGVTDSFIERISKTPPDQMWYPTIDELIENHIITHQVKENKAVEVKSYF